MGKGRSLVASQAEEQNVTALHHTRTGGQEARFPSLQHFC
jgi:hypothetical protein